MSKRIVLITLTLAIAASPVFADATLEDLRSDDPAVQIEAARSLGMAKNEAAVPALIEILETTTNQQLAATAAAALGAIGKAGASTNALLQTARSARDAGTQYASIAALAALDDGDRKEDIIAVIQEVGSDTDHDLVRDLASKLETVVSNQ